MVVHSEHSHSKNNHEHSHSEHAETKVECDSHHSSDHSHSHSSHEKHNEDSGHSHSHSHKEKENVSSDETHHDHHGHSHDSLKFTGDSHENHHDHHGHSHDHGDDDCAICDTKMSSMEDVKDEPIPSWKQKALSSTMDPSVAPFGGNWNFESSVSATDSAKTIDHGHTHQAMDNPGLYSQRPTMLPKRSFEERAFTVGIGGPVGSGKTALMLALCKMLRDKLSVAVVTNDIFTREDGEFLIRNNALPKERILAVETGGCPHAAIREDISANLNACEKLSAAIPRPDIILLESGGDNLAANFSNELADFTIYVIDVAGGDKVPRKGGPGVTQSDILVINKTDLASVVGSSLEIMKRDSIRMRGEGLTVFAQVKEGLSGEGLQDIYQSILVAWKKATSKC